MQNAKCKVQKTQRNRLNALPDPLPPSFLLKAKNPPPSEREAKEAPSGRELAKSQILTEGETDSPNRHLHNGGGHRPLLRCPCYTTDKLRQNITLLPVTAFSGKQSKRSKQCFYNYYYKNILFKSF